MVHYKSNICYSPVDLVTGEFMFTFDVKNIDTSLEGSNFNLMFEIKDGETYNKFSLTNTSPISSNDYYFNISNEYVLKKIKDFEPTTFFDDEIIFLGMEPLKLLSPSDTDVSDYKVINGKTYIKTKKYSIAFLDNSYCIRRNNDIDNNGNFIRPIELCYTNSKVRNTFIEYYTDKNNIYNPSIPHTYRIIVADKGQLISLWQKRGEQFEKIKTFSYANTLEKAEIYFSIDDSMILSNLMFGFFQNEHQTT